MLNVIEEQIREYKQSKKKEKYLKQLVSVYGNPWSKERGNFRDAEKRKEETSANNYCIRFEQDQISIIEAIIELMGISESNFSNLDTTLLKILGLLIDDNPELSSASVKKYLLNTKGFSSTESHLTEFQANQKALVKIILDRVIEEGKVPKFYDYDYIDDIVPIIKSRYLTTERTSNEAFSNRFLSALELLCTGTLVASGYEKLPEHIVSVLGRDHDYVPNRGRIDPQAADTIADVVDEFVSMRGEDNPKRFLDINLIYSMRVRHDKEPPYSKRDLSLIRGFETNHHLMLRTIVRLIKDGKIKSDDEILIIGPRHVDEIKFFRNHLGLKNTVGLDLFNEKDLIMYGDMHDMPFEDNRFKLIYSAKTFPYAYNLRKVINELGRVTQRPGYIVNIDSAGRATGPDPLGRTDTVNLETVLSMYYPFRHTIIAQDNGRSHNPEKRSCWPCYAIELH